MKKTMIFALALLAAAGCAAQQPKTESTVAVQGTGTVYVAPDMVNITVTIAQVSPTSRQAQEAVNRRTGMVMDVLRAAKIEAKDIQTASLTISPQYNWDPNEKRNILVGQYAQQRLDVSLRKVDVMGALIDQLVDIDGIELGGVNFSVDNNTANFEKARELAYAKARAKAEQYAALSGMKVGRVLIINEGVEDNVFTPLARNGYKATDVFADFSMDTAGATIPTGLLEVSMSVSIVFELK